MGRAMIRRAIGTLAIVVWMTWGYLRLTPPARLIRYGGQLQAPHYTAWAYNHLAYSDVVKLYQTRMLFLHLIPYMQTRIEYPVVTGLFMWITAMGQGILAYFLVTFVAFLLIAIGIYLLLEQMVPKHAIYFACLPMLMVYGLLNWDLLGIGFMVIGWYFYQRQSYWISGIMFSLGVFAKLFPIFFLPFVAVELLKNRKTAQLLEMIVAFMVTSLLINLPFALTKYKYWSYFYTFNAHRGVGADIYENHWIHGISTAAANTFSLTAVLLTTLYLMWRVRQGDQVAHATALTFTVFLFVNKVYSPQYTLWLMVFAILAEWPVWTYVLMTMIGLVDYVNSFTLLHLYNIKSPSARWYNARVFPLGLLLRYLGLVVVGLGVELSSWTNAAARNPQKTKRSNIGTHVS